MINKCGKFSVKVLLHYIDIPIFALGYFILPHPVDINHRSLAGQARAFLADYLSIMANKYFYCRLKAYNCIDFLCQKINLSGITATKRSRSRQNSVYVDR